MSKEYRKTWLTHFVEDKRYAAMTGLGFSSGLPFLLVYSTQSAWLSEAGVSIKTIGLLSELTVAYKFKFLWSPFLDKYDPPLLAPFVGRRRGWIILSQIAVMLALTGVAFGDPAHWIAWTIVFSLALGFAGATQDVTIDGWRITAAPPGKQSLMTALFGGGLSRWDANRRRGRPDCRRSLRLACSLHMHGCPDDDRRAIRFFGARARF
jgi:MFS transporter, PAT family, beta-lactamase induction signal transducer AmpG